MSSHVVGRRRHLEIANTLYAVFFGVIVDSWVEKVPAQSTLRPGNVGLVAVLTAYYVLDWVRMNLVRPMEERQSILRQFAFLFASIVSVGLVGFAVRMATSPSFTPYVCLGTHFALDRRFENANGASTAVGAGRPSAGPDVELQVGRQMYACIQLLLGMALVGLSCLGFVIEMPPNVKHDDVDQLAGLLAGLKNLLFWLAVTVLFARTAIGVRQLLSLGKPRVV